MEIEDCKGNISFISIPLTLDTKSGLWIGKGGITQLPGCIYSEGSLTLLMNNECGGNYLVSKMKMILKIKK
ncbi:MAG: hypothetical protein IPK03_16955 [Bacteroidetes bacterium]|nr:hypothetical protein [Bacteroidota bacterium]